MIVDVHPTHQINTLDQGALHLGGNPVTSSYTQRAIHADGNIDYQIWPEAVSLDLLNLFHAMHR